MRLTLVLVMIGVAMIAGCTTAAARLDNATLSRQVADTERAFAHTMAARDHAAFMSFLSPEAVFFSGDKALRGSQRIADAWKPYYEGPAAPFSWEPAHVEVLDSGTLALSSGPVRDAQGRLIATFNSIWRRDATGKWRIVFDKGSDVCAPRPQ